MEALVDSNVIIDILTEDPDWMSWSAAAVESWDDVLVINPIICAEISISFEKIEDLQKTVSRELFRRDPLPWEAAFLAGKCFLKYRQRGGKKRSPLPDFFIGAHAAVSKMALITRDPSRYRTYFPKIRLISPDSLKNG